MTSSATAALAHPRQGIEQGITSRINITDQDVSGYYNDHKAEFNLIEAQYHLAKIVVSGVGGTQVHNLQNSRRRTRRGGQKVRRSPTASIVATTSLRWP